ncbi:Octaprenyl-diphosphate synthase [Rubripirellula obstinata]|uniref:Octaprenyl-diphosphate synthase n=2 Tax=Rubripirellula obstinata TaxID=406547 RepID=A0A5B1CI36_9BACT|nr:Octaprenyl-diphosphate synthase [Rubripirellula obstinata]
MDLTSITRHDPTESSPIQRRSSSNGPSNGNCASNGTGASNGKRGHRQMGSFSNSDSRNSSEIGNSDIRGASELLRRMYGPIEAPMAEIEKRIAAELQSPYEAIGHLLRHGTQLGGKRMRPALILLSGQCIGETNEQHTILGTIIEMVHTATLIHDDVLDEAETRRHVPTVNAKWSNHTSILLGDYLFAQSFRLAASMASNEACQWIGEAARLVCEGEMRQVLQRDTLDIDEATYFDILRGKTAELCRVSCELGALHSGGTESQVDALGRFGNAIGIAFQIADDYLDLWGDDDTVGKTLGTDIEQGKMTLPLIRLLETSSLRNRERIVAILRGPSEERLPAIRPLLEASDAKDYTESMAQQFRREAISALDELEPTQAKESLLTLADFAVDRRF